MKQINSFLKRLITWIVFAVIFWGIFIYSPLIFNILIFAILLEILVFEWCRFFKPSEVKFWLIMPFYIILPFLSIIALNTPEYRMLLAISVILTFCFDTGAYLTGSLFGRNKIAPSISPAKTYEGLIGGYIFSLCSLTIFFVLTGRHVKVFIVWFTLIIGTLAFWGDLFESYLKRSANIKDSGFLLPGHGGFLDRFDSVLAVTIFIYLFRNILVNYL